jgi:hypothetical protein
MYGGGDGSLAERGALPARPAGALRWRGRLASRSLGLKAPSWGKGLTRGLHPTLGERAASPPVRLLFSDAWGAGGRICSSRRETVCDGELR